MSVSVNSNITGAPVSLSFYFLLFLLMFVHIVFLCLLVQGMRALHCFWHQVSPKGLSDVFVTPTFICLPHPLYLSNILLIAKSLNIVVGTMGSEIKLGSGFKSKQESGSQLPLRLVVCTILGQLFNFFVFQFLHL